MLLKMVYHLKFSIVMEIVENKIADGNHLHIFSILWHLDIY